MSRYRFELQDYHAVRKAVIEIDGITVLAGPNGCGKSTVARWLDYCVTTLTEYDAIMREKFVSEVHNFTFRLERSLRGVRSSDSKLKLYILDKINEIYQIDSDEPLVDATRAVLDPVVDFIAANLKEKSNEADIERYQRYFGLEPVPNESADEFAARLLMSLTRTLEWMISENEARHMNQTEQNYCDALKSMVDPMVDDYHIVMSMSFHEDGSDLLGKVFNVPLMLDHSIYLNTQSLGRALDGENSRIAKMLAYEIGYVPDNVRRVAAMVRLIINGGVSEESDETSFVRSKRLQYVRKDGLKIYLKGAATGIISFAYILRLLENGWINEGTLLIIDEPEAHLHPQWIVDYARMLVLICREIGAKIVVSSHNPDMIAAIQSISRKEGMLDKVHFYLGEETEPDSGKFDFLDLKSDIGPIFDSFNIALDRIAIYGEEV